MIIKRVLVPILNLARFLPGRERVTFSSCPECGARMKVVIHVGKELYTRDEYCPRYAESVSAHGLEPCPRCEVPREGYTVTRWISHKLYASQHICGFVWPSVKKEDTQQPWPRPERVASDAD